MTQTEIRTVLVLTSIFALRIFGMFIVLPILSSYGIILKDVSKSLIGLAIGIYGLTQAVFQIPFGLISDKIGRKPMIIIGLLIFMIGSIIAAMTDTIWGIILGRALQGSGAISSVIMATVSDLVREQNRTKAMAFIGTSFGITFIISIVLSPIITNALGLHGLFFFVAFLTLLGIILAISIKFPCSYKIFNQKLSVIHNEFSSLLHNKQLIKLNFSIFFLHAILMSNFVAWPYIIEHSGILILNQWKLYLSSMVVSLIFIIPIVYIVEKKRCIKKFFLASIILMLFSEIIFLTSKTNILILFIGMHLFFLSFNLLEIILPSFFSKETPQIFRGTAMGIYSTSQFLGAAFGGISSGILFEIQGSWMVFTATIILTLIWLIISYSLKEPPYISNLCILLSNKNYNVENLNKKLSLILQTQPGVTEIIVVPEEKSVYVKVDTEKTCRVDLEKFLNN